MAKEARNEAVFDLLNLKKDSCSVSNQQFGTLSALETVSLCGLCEVSGQRVAFWHVSNRSFPNEVGHRRGTAASPSPLPPSQTVQARFRAYSFPDKQIIALGISKDLRIARPFNPGSSDLFLLPPFALRSDLPISLVGRDSYDSYGSSVTMQLALCR